VELFVVVEKAVVSSGQEPEAMAEALSKSEMAGFNEVWFSNREVKFVASQFS
jgi:hypothetical protein